MVAVRKLRSARAEGFTLVELLVVIAVIGILAALLMPAVMRALGRAHESKTQSLIHECQTAAQGFFNDYGDYPPSTWDEMFALFEYDTTGDGVYTSGVDVDFTTFPVDPAAYNQGIEVFLACVATETGGPYMELGEFEFGNTDNDVDNVPTPDIASATNWYFGLNADTDGDNVVDNYNLYEIVDFWANPLVYVHNRNYYDTDGPPVPGNEYIPYATFEGEEVRAFSRDATGLAAGTPPRLTEFQLFSLGRDGVENLTDIGDVNGDGVTDFEMTPGWQADGDFLTNWEE